MGMNTPGKPFMLYFLRLWSTLILPCKEAKIMTLDDKEMLDNDYSVFKSKRFVLGKGHANL